ncbi:NAD(P)H-hydrate dehydratase [Microcella alkaliphila]|uniref:ADP-dependent (S)-NAD(P)H-hydrate dehydratase n=1 Tax=Microcella alkaliphila TaxID=279828 RepID=A0A0U5BAG4_9MICO|nr:NAD(P)H-hydrate dehydratase [Microcella alkaliphila]BAU32745.1 ADP-dependent (S)-NAD(P)H-hydrate dehydratase [Microcella alkaliphila]
MSGEAGAFGVSDAATCIRVPKDSDDKYARGVLGVVAGSDRYPGAAVLAVEAALRAGLGMVRYLGPRRAADLVLARRPEAVTASGRVQAWLIGSGLDDSGETDPLADDRVSVALEAGAPLVLDAGALPLARDPRARSVPRVLTPHAGELARLTGVERATVAADPERAARDAAVTLDAVVLLKGATTRIATPDGRMLVVAEATPWLATAGAGDALAGILGALVATHARDLALSEIARGADHDRLAELAAAAAVVHGRAARRASAGGPLTILDLCAAVPAVIRGLLDGSER